jgi:predicted nucleic acid-binding protein
MIKVFIDASGWQALIKNDHENHESAREYFQQLLDSRARLYTNITEITIAISRIKNQCGLGLATEFSRTIDQAVLSSDLNVSWMTRRMQRAALRQFFSIKEIHIEIRHCMIFEEVRKKKINLIFSFDMTLQTFGIPLMPQI